MIVMTEGQDHHSVQYSTLAMPRCASDDPGATLVNTIWTCLTKQAMNEHIQYSTVLNIIVAIEWSSIVQYTVRKGVALGFLLIKVSLYTENLSVICFVGN